MSMLDVISITNEKKIQSLMRGRKSNEELQRRYLERKRNQSRPKD